MDRPYDFPAIPRIAALPLALSGPGVATALAEALFPIRGDETIGACGQDVPSRVPRWTGSDAGRSSVWPVACAARAVGG